MWFLVHIRHSLRIARIRAMYLMGMVSAVGVKWYTPWHPSLRRDTKFHPSWTIAASTTTEAIGVSKYAPAVTLYGAGTLLLMGQLFNPTGPAGSARCVGLHRQNMYVMVQFGTLGRALWTQCVV